MFNPVKLFKCDILSCDGSFFTVNKCVQTFRLVECISCLQLGHSLTPFCINMLLEITIVFLFLYFCHYFTNVYQQQKQETARQKTVRVSLNKSEII